RVEPGEVESALLGVPGVTAAVVAAGGGVLVGFAVGDVDAGAARAAVADVLPEWAVPTRVWVVDDFPLTDNGKIDRAALLDLDRARRGGGTGATRPDGVAGLWCDVLDVDDIGEDDDFVTLGGDSRLALVLAGRVLERYPTVRPGRLLACRTVAEMTAVVRDARPVAADPRPVPAVLPLSYGQEGLWTWQHMYPDALAFVLPVALRVHGDGPDPRTAVAAVLAGHEAFALRFRSTDGVPWAIRSTEPPMVDVDTEPVPVADLPARLVAAHRDAATRIVELTGVPWRVRIVPVADGDHVVLLSVHHLVFDGTSVGVFVRDLAAVLGGASLTPVGGPVDHAVAQRNAAWPAEREYWRDVLRPLPDALDLPTDRSRRVGHADGGRVHTQVLDDAATALLDRFAGSRHTSRFTVLLAALATLASRYTGRRDFVLATVTSADRAAGWTGSIGYFANLLPVRCVLEPGETFADTVTGTATRLRDAVANAALPFERILSEAGGERSGNAARYTRLVVAQDLPAGLPARAADVVLDAVPLDPGTAKYELCVF
ncbi:MAG TPA: condensation domain-containing protein, partial [Pseudonocardiaceae bacterium]|nr:condensation domain-containing protein [Pseudonocardiaceae bacterium]